MTMLIPLLFAVSSEAQESFLAPGAPIEVVAKGLQFTEGPCAMPDGSLVFSDIPANKMYRWKDSKLEVYRNPSHNANGHTLDPQGRLVSCEHGARRVERQEKDGRMTVLAESWEGKRLNSPNDVAIRKDGAIFFTDPPYGIQPSQAEHDFNGVYAIVDGKMKLLDKSFDRPNGLVFSPDEKLLYVADTSKGHIRRFEVAHDGSLSGGVDAWAKTPNPDGLRVDSEGRVWSASSDGVNVISREGKVLEVIKFPEQPANLTFSRDGKTLYVTARTGVYSVKVRVRGLAP